MAQQARNRAKSRLWLLPDTTLAVLLARLTGLLQTIWRFLDEVRIREHLRRTERALRARDHSHLTPAQRRRRERHLDRLRAYWQRGAFPTNREQPGRVPCFVGANGVPCAVAHLIQTDGHDDLVDTIATTTNTVHIESLDDGPVLDWLEHNGFTQAEAARIQPTYGSGVQFATTCGPVPCWLAGMFVSVVGMAVFAAAEYIGYRVAADLFPENALKRRGALGYFTVMNLFLAPLVAALLYALFP